MAEPDLQIGSLYTDPGHRGLGLATGAVGATLVKLQNMGFWAAAWYIVDDNNNASKSVAERNDFSIVGRGHRARRLHTVLLGSYIADEALGRASASFNYATVTERRDMRGPPEQRAMGAVRQAFVSRIAAQGCLVDVGCGTGLGLPTVASRARLAVGLDINLPNLLNAQSHFPDGNFVLGNGLQLPIRDQSIEAISCLEALYYFPDPPAFIAEAHRVLCSGGRLAIVVTNPARPGFLPSPGSTIYPTLELLMSWMTEAGFSDVAAYGAFPWAPKGAGNRAKEAARRMVGHVGIMPSSLKSRSWIKQLAYRDMRRLDTVGPTVDLDRELQDLPHDATSATARYKSLLLCGSRD